MLRGTLFNPLLTNYYLWLSKYHYYEAYFVFQDSFGKIKEDLEKSYSYQKSMRAIESRSRSVNEHNFERVNFWGAIVSFVMAGVALVNVLMIRGLFEEKKNTHKFMKVST